jgi:hypothetical protein
MPAAELYVTLAPLVLLALGVAGFIWVRFYL